MSFVLDKVRQLAIILIHYKGNILLIYKHGITMKVFKLVAQNATLWTYCFDRKHISKT